VFYQCWYCNQFSNRLDNWRDHLKRHTDHDKQTDRIKYFPEAVGRHKDEMRRVKESRKSKSKLPPGIIIIREGDPRFEEAKRAASRG
jgi:DNA relaxase NicK